MIVLNGFLCPNAKRESGQRKYCGSDFVDALPDRPNSTRKSQHHPASGAGREQQLPDGSTAQLPDIPIGAQVRVLPNHACATGAQHDLYHVVRTGSRDEVEEADAVLEARRPTQDGGGARAEPTGGAARCGRGRS